VHTLLHCIAQSMIGRLVDRVLLLANVGEVDAVDGDGQVAHPRVRELAEMMEQVRGLWTELEAVLNVRKQGHLHNREECHLIAPAQ